MTADRLPDDIELQVSRVHAKDGCTCHGNGACPCCMEVRDDLRRAILAVILEREADVRDALMQQHPSCWDRAESSHLRARAAAIRSGS